MRRLVPILLLALFPALAAAQQRPKLAKPELPETGFASVRLAMRSIPTVKVTVNGEELTLGVDTGCQGSGVLTTKAVERLGLTPSLTLPTMGNTGRNETDFVFVREFAMGGAVWRDFHLAVLPLDGIGLDGLVGAEILFGQPFYMDLANRVMILGKIPDTSGAREVSCFSRGGHVNINIEVEGRKVPMLIDSGASLSYITSMKYKGRVAHKGYAPVATVRGVSMRRQDICLPTSMSLGGLPLRGVILHRDNEHNILGDDFLLAHPIAVDRASRRLWLFEPIRLHGRAPARPEPAR
jgi:predicted aspartyl protease